MAKQAQEALRSEELTVVADRGYFTGEELFACEEAGITTYVPKPHTSGNEAKGLFRREDFRYVAGGRRLSLPGRRAPDLALPQRRGGQDTATPTGVRTARVARSRAAAPPVNTGASAAGSTRRSSRRCKTRLDREPEKMRLRRQTVEHPFGTLKAWMGYTHFLTGRCRGCSTEMSLHVLAYNLKRVMNILGTAALMDAMRA